jgi:hypothetical protein
MTGRIRPTEREREVIAEHGQAGRVAWCVVALLRHGCLTGPEAEELVDEYRRLIEQVDRSARVRLARSEPSIN